MSSSSPFAAVLRRSKFAAFDPCIAQVYTSHGGYAHRGDYGFKRPLPIRKRGAAVTVDIVDSREQQTEWQGAHLRANTLKQWDEHSAPILLEEMHPRFGLPHGNNPFDTDFAPQALPRSSPFGIRRAVPNVEAMSPRNFDRYVERVRRLRPGFLPWLQAEERKRLQKRREEADRTGGPISNEVAALDTDLYGFSRQPKNSDIEYLTHVWGQQFDNKHSRIIEPQPHALAGLSYTESSNLQTRLLARPASGHSLHLYTKGKSIGGEIPSTLVSFAGIVAGMPSKRSAAIPPAIRRAGEGFDLEDNRGRAQFRIFRAELRADPNVVTDHVIASRHDHGARRNRMLNARMDVLVESASTPDPSTWNPEVPGTRNYMQYLSDVSATTQTPSRPTRLASPAEWQTKSANTGKSESKEKAQIVLTSLLQLLKDRNDGSDHHST